MLVWQKGIQLAKEVYRNTALGSLAEVDTQLILAKELGFLSPAGAQTADQLITEIRKMFHGLSHK